ncbi:hypothetical protein ONZ45_g6353 [Pleurotus djamor]|nr:hypothetical protein ONZ45_g6353 [Pleurotus djamor]
MDEYRPRRRAPTLTDVDRSDDGDLDAGAVAKVDGDEKRGDRNGWLDEGNADPEVDANVQAELLEAVDAAEAAWTSSDGSSVGGMWAK